MGAAGVFILRKGGSFMPLKDLFHHNPVDDGTTGSAEDVEKLMRKYDRESNTRIWEGTPALVVRLIMVAFSLYCIGSTLFSVAALEKRLTAFLALILVMGYLTYPPCARQPRPLVRFRADGAGRGRVSLLLPAL